jgi:class 3 adenylate cyclase/HAMP domain-containing protein
MGGSRPDRIRWLPPLVLLVNAGVLGLFVTYSALNLRPDMPREVSVETVRVRIGLHALLTVLAPTIASFAFVRPISRWARGPWRRPDGDGGHPPVPSPIAERAAHTPLALALGSLLAWLLLTGFAAVLALGGVPPLPLGTALHVIVRPLLAGFVASTTIFFAADHVCRAHVWPVTLAGLPIGGNARLWRVRVSHRLLALWFAIGVVPLMVVILTTSLHVADLDLREHPVLARVTGVVLLTATSAAIGGAWLAWMVSRSVGRPLRALERAMAQLREGRFDTRAPVSATDETGTLAEGFNLMAGRLAESYAALEARNRQLAAAMERILMLEGMKRALDRFVPESARRAIEEHPDAPDLAKTTHDVTVLFLDIEGYAGLAERLDRATLNGVVEQYFSRYLTPILDAGGEINEIAGDGLMIIFQAGAPAEHAGAAVRAALDIREQTAAANREAASTQPPIVVNVGISSGECDVGATRFRGPSGERWTFTATGPTTNRAARLGDYADGGQILMDSITAERVRGRVELCPLGAVLLKNMSSPVEVWEVGPRPAPVE